MYETVKGEFGDTAIWRDKPRSEPLDPKLDRITLSAYLRETGWTVEMLDYAIGRYNHPKPTGRTVHPDHTTEPFYQKTAIASWRETVKADLQRLGFKFK